MKTFLRGPNTCKARLLPLSLFAAGTLAQAQPCPDTNVLKVFFPPQLNGGVDVKGSRNGFVLADDFYCTYSGPITDIHIWGSWLNDVHGTITNFWLGIYDDVPAVTNLAIGPVTPSHPGTNLLWQQSFLPGQFAENPYAPAVETFYNPSNQVVLGNDTQAWYYCFYPANPFVQQGSVAFPTNYWLAARAQLAPDGTTYGWKTTTTPYNDAAVWGTVGPSGLPNGNWQPMTNPPTQQPINLAFKLNTTNTTTCAEGNGVKYVQWPNLLGGLDVWDSVTRPSQVTDGPWWLSDDFVCTNTGPITDIHLWGSWQNNAALPNSITFQLYVLDDVPANAVSNPFSHPGTNIVWHQTFPPGSYAEVIWNPNASEYFLDPGIPQILGGDNVVWYYCFYPTNLIQYGSPGQATNYWLAAFAELPAGTTNVFGWKSTTNVQNDISVHGAWPGFGVPPTGLPWKPNFESPGSQQPFDLAFKLTTPCTAYVVCPPTNKIVPCDPATWANFHICCPPTDPPLIVDSCCTNDFWVGYFAFVGSNSCSQTWSVIYSNYDCSSHLLGVCTQYVSVLVTNPPVFNGCVPAKTAQCGLPWSFDTPTAQYLCNSNNVAVGIVSTITNVVNACSNIVTRVWGATNECTSAFATCTEVVTITDTNPPTITCPTNIVVYTCGTNPVVVTWPTNGASATCGTATVTSLPPPGTAFLPDTTNTVVLTAYNACGVSNTCSFTVAVRRPMLGPIAYTLVPTNRVVLTWTYGILQSTTNILVPFMDVPGASSPYTNSTVPPPVERFYRLRCASP